jgi:hypothetical protein
MSTNRAERCGCQTAPNREAAMVVLDPEPLPGVHKGVWCDPCIAPIVKALNDGGLPTVASCCGHGERDGRITLADGREVLIR